MKNKLARLAALAAASISGHAMALPVDYTSLTTQIDLSTTSAALLLAAGALIGVAILWKGAKMIVRAFGG
ncbi:MAG: hypothetical protein Q8K12_17590 [Thiobacillus sp.]|nr:hypothetical protein [Thiobacillus sp.]